MNDESRRALRDLARQAEWHGHAGAAGAALDARTLRELGREIDNALAREPDRETWGHRASASLAAYCQRAQPDWTPEQIAELNRLRDDALTALAPGPGEAEAEAEAAAASAAAKSATGRRPRSNSGARPTIPGLAALTSRRPATIALAVVGCIVLIALVLFIPHFVGNNSAQTPTASSTTAIPATPTTIAPTTTESAPADSDTSTATTSTSASAGAPTTSSASSSHVTAIQFTPDVLPGDPPEVIVTGSFSTSGTGDVTVYITISGSSGTPQVTPVDDSGQTSYDLTQTINLDQWCGQSSVRLTVSSGTVSKSTTISISGC